jgi:hypothetical protein
MTLSESLLLHPCSSPKVSGCDTSPKGHGENLELGSWFLGTEQKSLFQWDDFPVHLPLGNQIILVESSLREFSLNSNGLNRGGQAGNAYWAPAVCQCGRKIIISNLEKRQNGDYLHFCSHARICLVEVGLDLCHHLILEKRV